MPLFDMRCSRRSRCRQSLQIFQHRYSTISLPVFPHKMLLKAATRNLLAVADNCGHNQPLLLRQWTAHQGPFHIFVLLLLLLSVLANFIMISPNPLPPPPARPKTTRATSRDPCSAMLAVMKPPGLHIAPAVVRNAGSSTSDH